MGSLDSLGRRDVALPGKNNLDLLPYALST